MGRVKDVHRRQYKAYPRVRVNEFYVDNYDNELTFNGRR